MLYTACDDGSLERTRNPGNAGPAVSPSQVTSLRTSDLTSGSTNPEGRTNSEVILITKAMRTHGAFNTGAVTGNAPALLQRLLTRTRMGYKTEEDFGGRVRADALMSRNTRNDQEFLKGRLGPTTLLST